jgi:hypothetical protein
MRPHGESFTNLCHHAVEFLRDTFNRIIYVQRQNPNDLFTTRHNKEAFVGSGSGQSCCPANFELPIEPGLRSQHDAIDRLLQTPKHMAADTVNRRHDKNVTSERLTLQRGCCEVPKVWNPLFLSQYRQIKALSRRRSDCGIRRHSVLLFVLVSPSHEPCFRSPCNVVIHRF